MTRLIVRRAAALGLALSFAAAVFAPASAAPISGQSSVTAALSNHATEVRWRGGRGWGGGAWIGAGVATGLVLGGIAASRYYGPGYYYPGYVYGPGYPVYAEPVYAPPPRVYAAPAPLPDNGVRQCFVTTNADRGLGYWRPC